MQVSNDCIDRDGVRLDCVARYGVLRCGSHPAYSDRVVTHEGIASPSPVELKELGPEKAALLDTTNRRHFGKP
eukprot:31174-Eustigmatos_ZCMA.PRE.1